MLTVDRNSNGFGQVEAISADEGRDAVEGVKQLVLGGGVGRAGLDELDVEIIRLSNTQENF